MDKVFFKWMYICGEKKSTCFAFHVFVSDFSGIVDTLQQALLFLFTMSQVLLSPDLIKFSWKVYLSIRCVWLFAVQDHSKHNLLLRRGTEKWGGTLEFYILICEQEFFRKQSSYSFFWERFLCPINQEEEFQGASSYLYVITHSVQSSEICIICIKKEKRLLLTAKHEKSEAGGFKVYVIFLWWFWVLRQHFEINDMIPCKTDAAGIDCCSGWQVLKRPQTREYWAEEWFGERWGKGIERNFTKGASIGIREWNCS